MTSLNREFQRLANDFLSAHPSIQHEWRQIASFVVGNRLDLVCAPGSENEVFASLHGFQVTIGPTADGHDDFEDFGRGMSEEEVAREAFKRFMEVLVEQGHLAPRSASPNDLAEKDSSILEFLELVTQNLSHDAFHVVDHWDADLFAIGFAAPINHRRLAYVSTFGLPGGRIHVHLAAPNRNLANPIRDEKHDNVTYAEAISLIATHLG